MALGACTLTGDDYQPTRVDALPNQPPDAAAPGQPQGCAGAAECCENQPCAPAEACVAGTCQPFPVDAADAGRCSGGECPLPEMLVPPSNTGDSAASSCSDRVLNGNEVLTDCGGGDCPGCPDGSVCSVGTDCASGRCGAQGRCAAPSCNDGVANGNESARDCGGSCTSCLTGSACNGPADCQSGVCRNAGCGPGVAQCCQAPSCGDRVTNANESDIDCGGRCPDCPTGRACDDPGDCQSGVCASAGCAPGVRQCCQAPSCSDGVTNGGEPVVDCGNLACGLCSIGSACTQASQCSSGLCQAGVCADPGSCSDGVRNGSETAPDCGGSCPRCADRLPCTQASDCVNNNCFDGVCISCGSTVLDGTETDIDCGGADPACRRCGPGESCLINGDCLSGFCLNGSC